MNEEAEKRHELMKITPLAEQRPECKYPVESLCILHVGSGNHDGGVLVQMTEQQRQEHQDHDLSPTLLAASIIFITANILMKAHSMPGTFLRALHLFAHSS